MNLVVWTLVSVTLVSLVSFLGLAVLSFGEQAIRKCFEHQTHHRGQTAVYLRMAGVTPPSMKLF